MKNWEIVFKKLATVININGEGEDTRYNHLIWYYVFQRNCTYLVNPVSYFKSM